jgi:hypothetical protein
MTLAYDLSRENRAPKPQEINRIGGRPLGVDHKNWPMIFNPNILKKQPMIHVLTIDARALQVPIAKSIRALALFVSSAEMPFYCGDRTSDYKVLALTDKEIARGELEGPTHPEEEEEPLPAGVLCFEPSTSESNSRSFSGKEPKWIQPRSERNSNRGFVLQFDSWLVPLNLGDSGVLYMFDTWAYWECY